MSRRPEFRDPYVPQGPWRRADMPTTAEFEKSLANCATLIQRGYPQLVAYYEVLERWLAESRERDRVLSVIFPEGQKKPRSKNRKFQS
jgi:hypothetical protein